MKTSVCYIVSSHASYQEPLRWLLGSMEHVPWSHKFIAIGGASSSGVHGGIPNAFHVMHNSFDYTALIQFVDSDFDFKPSHVFLLHDTMEFTPETDSLIRRADPDVDATAAVHGCVCNLGLFRTDYLMSKREQILKMRNCTKLEAVQFEGVLWKDAPRRDVYPNATVDVLSESPVYGGAVRRTERYNSVGILKHKASWGQLMETIGERIKP